MPSFSAVQPFSCKYADLWDFRQFSQLFLFLLAIHSLLVEIELRSVFVQPCSYFSEIWTAKRLDFGIFGVWLWSARSAVQPFS